MDNAPHPSPSVDSSPSFESRPRRAWPMFSIRERERYRQYAFDHCVTTVCMHSEIVPSWEWPQVSLVVWETYKMFFFMLFFRTKKIKHIIKTDLQYNFYYSFLSKKNLFFYIFFFLFKMNNLPSYKRSLSHCLLWVVRYFIKLMVLIISDNSEIFRLKWNQQFGLFNIIFCFSYKRVLIR